MYGEAYFESFNLTMFFNGRVLHYRGKDTYRLADAEKI